MKDIDLIPIVSIICITAVIIAGVLSSSDNDCKEINNRIDRIEQVLKIEKADDTSTK